MHGAVRAAAAAEVVPLHRALEALTFRPSRDVNVFANLKYVRTLDFSARLMGVQLSALNLGKPVKARRSSLFKVSLHGLIYAALFLLKDTYLKRVISVLLFRLSLNDIRGSGDCHSNRNLCACLGIYMRHADLFCKYSFYHNTQPLFCFYRFRLL